MDPSFLMLLRQSLPDYLVSSLGLAGVTSLDLFLALSDDHSPSRDVIPLHEVASYLREQLPLLSSHAQLRTYLPMTLSSAAEDLETARRLVEHWSFPPGTKYLLFRLQASLKAQTEPAPQRLPYPEHEEPSPAKLRCLDRSAKVQPLQDTMASVEEGETERKRRRSANVEPLQDTTMASVEEGETEQKRRRRRKRAKRSKKPPAPVPMSTPAPVPQASKFSEPVSSALPTNGPSRLGHVIFDSDGEVKEEREPVVLERALEVAQNRRTCKSKPNFEFPEMSKKAQLKSRQTNQSFFLKNDGSTPPVAAHSLRKSLPSVRPPEKISETPAKKKPALGPKIFNVDLDGDDSSSSSTTSSSSSSSSPPEKTSKVVSQEQPTDAQVWRQKDTELEGEEASEAFKENDDTQHSRELMDVLSPVEKMNGSHAAASEAEECPVAARCPVVEPTDYGLLESLKKPPQEGSVIAFKILELNPENFTPEISDFKEGRLVSFDRSKRRCHIEVLSNKRTCVGEGKFDVWIESSDGQVLTNFEEEERMLMTSWDALQEVKLIRAASSTSS